MKSRNYLAICTAFLLLTACSDDDSKTDEQAGETSELAPGDVPDNAPSSTPGGDTTAIAGLWNARTTTDGQVDERYVEITTDGLYTEYDFRQDDLASDGNCYLSYGPLTLTPEDATTNTYGLSDDRSFSATGNGDNSILSITFSEGSLQEWPVVTGLSTTDFDGCADIQE